MHTLFNYGNVYLDAASAYKWDELNEKVFIEKVFHHLAQSMSEQFWQYNFFIFSCHSSQVMPASLQCPLKNKVLIFISDETSSYPASLKERYTAVFKSYLPYERKGDNIFPFSLGYVNEVPLLRRNPIHERDIDIFFSGNLNFNRFPLYKELNPYFKYMPDAIGSILIKISSKLRINRIPSGKNHLNEKNIVSYIRFTNGFKQGLSAAEYGEILSNSKITLCPKGFSSTETFRHIEALRAGSIVVSEPLPKTHFYQGAPIIIVDSWRNGLKKVKSLLTDGDLLGALQEKSLDWYEKICSESATADYIHTKLKYL